MIVICGIKMFPWIDDFSCLSPFLYGVLAVCICCVGMYLIVYLRQVVGWKRSNIPFLLPTIFFGHKYFLNSHKCSATVAIDRIYRESADKDLIAFFMTTIPVILVRDPHLIKQTCSKHSDKFFFSALSGSNKMIEAQNFFPLTGDRKTWKSSRQMMAPWFSKSSIGDLEFRMAKCLMERTLRHAMENQPQRPSINVRKIASSFFLDYTSKYYLEEEVNSFYKKDVAEDVLNNFFENSVRRMLCLVFNIQFRCLREFDLFPILSSSVINPLRKLVERKTKTKSELDEKRWSFLDDMISKCRGCNRQNNSQEGAQQVRVNEEKILRRITGLALIFPIGGTHTSIGTSVFAIHLLSLHPGHQERIRNEVELVMKQNGVSEINLNVVHDLKFTEQCVYETVRLFPLTSFLMRYCSENFHVPETNYHFNKGDRILIPAYSLHRDPKYFRDPEKFDPDRFSPENVDCINPDACLMFGVGPRKCPAYRLGIFWITFVVASFIQNYEVKPRSHWKQLTAADFHPLTFTNDTREEIIVDLTPRERTDFKSDGRDSHANTAILPVQRGTIHRVTKTTIEVIHVRLTVSWHRS